MARKQYDDDDGRTIVDMTGVNDAGLSLFGRMPAREKRQPQPPGEQTSPYQQETEISKEEQRWYMLGAMKAALLIGFAFIAGLGLVILLLMAIWGIL